MRCPACRSEHPADSGQRLFIEAMCPICLEQKQPFVSLPCGHGVCEECISDLLRAGPIGLAVHPSRRQAEVTEQIEVPEQSKGMIIGKAGRVLQDMQRRPGIRHVGLHGTMLFLRGDREAVRALKVTVEDILERSASSSGSSGATGDAQEFVSVPDWAYGRIIGRGGAMIRELQQRPGIIRVSLTNGRLSFSGTRDAVDGVLSTVRELLPSAGPGEVEEHMDIDSAVIPLLIGRHGQKLHEIQSTAGIRIVNLRKSSLLVIGTQDGVKNAVAKVQAVLNRSILEPSSRNNHILCLDVGNRYVSFCKPGVLPRVILPSSLLQSSALQLSAGEDSRDASHECERQGSVWGVFNERELAKSVVSSVPNSKSGDFKLSVSSRIGALFFRDVGDIADRSWTLKELGAMKLGVDVKPQFVPQLLPELGEEITDMIQKEGFEEVGKFIDQPALEHRLQVVDRRARVNYILRCSISSSEDSPGIRVLECKEQAERICVGDISSPATELAQRIACTADTPRAVPEGLEEYLQSIDWNTAAGQQTTDRFSVDSVRSKRPRVFSNGVLEITISFVAHEAVGSAAITAAEVDVLSYAAVAALRKIYHTEPSPDWISHREDAIRHLEHLLAQVQVYIQRLATTRCLGASGSSSQNSNDTKRRRV